MSQRRVLVLCLFACGKQPAGKPAEQTTDLVQSRVPDEGDPGVRAVGAIVATKGQAPEASQPSDITIQCSAFVVGERHIVTAAHCFASTRCGGRQNPFGPAHTLYFVQGNDATEVSWSRRIVHRGCSPAYRPDTAGCPGDVAIGYLDAALPNGPWEAPAIVAADNRALEKLGYGWFLEEAHGGAPQRPSQRAAATLEVLTVDPSAARYQYIGRSASGTQVKICTGDSGGPGFQLRGDGFDLIGVTSQFTAAQPQDTCGTRGHDTQLVVYKPWIEENLATATPTTPCQ